jgi:hypothetical protein
VRISASGNSLPDPATDSQESIEFTNALLLTPARTNTDDRLFKLAPLLLIETAATNIAELPAADRPGSLEESNGLLRIAPSRAVVYAQRDAVTVRGRRLERFSYVWWYPPDSTDPQTTDICAQGIRITATPAGQSLIFEVLRSPGTAAVVVVSHSLESAALGEFRRPFPGRQFAVELPTDAPEAAKVARAIDDGPLELGPVVYLRRGRRTVATVICRCMPAQVRNIADTGYYDLVASSDGATPALLEQAKAQASLSTAWWLSPWSHDTNLEVGLRLPTSLPGTRPAR